MTTKADFKKNQKIKIYNMAEELILSMSEEYDSEVTCKNEKQARQLISELSRRGFNDDDVIFEIRGGCTHRSDGGCDYCGYESDYENQRCPHYNRICEDSTCPPSYNVILKYIDSDSDDSDDSDD